MKKVYVMPQMQVEAFSVEEIITASVAVPEGVTATIGAATVGEGINSDLVYSSFFAAE